ncbi:uncharacterized protein METZ01_LOCUS161094 [marine metagenome]|uniref:Uncharacterized protein n=1 Tax=marine metagenome TaxID=408172 RepID=A0A382B355_9ZZZZ
MSVYVSLPDSHAQGMTESNRAHF